MKTKTRTNRWMPLEEKEWRKLKVIALQKGYDEPYEMIVEDYKLNKQQ